MNKEIYILGVGHNTPVYIELAEACGYRVKGLYHYNNERTGEIDHSVEILGSYADLYNLGDLSNKNFALSMGDNKIRVEIATKIKELGGNLPNLIHPTAVVSRFCEMGKGIAIHANAVVHPNTKIGNYTTMSYNTALTHNSEIGCGCYLAGGATIGAYTIIHNQAFIGQGAITISGKVPYIGEKAIIGAGALVTKPVESKNVVMGNPAKVIKVLE